MPDLTRLPALNLLATIAFAFAGLELGAAMGEEVDRPRRNLPLSVLIAAPLIALAYIMGTAAVLWLVPPGELNRVAGFLQAIAGAAGHGGAWLGWLAPLCALLYVAGNVGGIGAWMAGPARVAFAIGLDRYFPRAFGSIHPRWHTPHVAIVVQAVLATVFLCLSVTGRGTTVEEVYLVLLDTQLLIYFIPYVYLFLVFLKSGGPWWRFAAGISGLGMTLFAMVVALIPPPGTVNLLLFQAKVAGGAAGFVLLGGVVYVRARAGGKLSGRHFPRPE